MTRHDEITVKFSYFQKIDRVNFFESQATDQNVELPPKGRAIMYVVSINRHNSSCEVNNPSYLLLFRENWLSFEPEEVVNGVNLAFPINGLGVEFRFFKIIGSRMSPQFKQRRTSSITMPNSSFRSINVWFCIKPWHLGQSIVSTFSLCKKHVIPSQGEVSFF